MTNSEQPNVQNLQSLVEHFETVIRDVTTELNEIQGEQLKIRDFVQENSHLSDQLHRAVSQPNVDHTFKEHDLIENLKLQLKAVTDEKNYAVQLWQKTVDSVDALEKELHIYKDTTEGLVPKSTLIELRNSYEEKLNELQSTVTDTKAKLEATISLKSRELEVKDKKLIGTLQSHDNTFKIIKNLEDEVLKLQERLKESNNAKSQLEKLVTKQNIEGEFLKLQVKECRCKVQEALQIVEAALAEKDAALLREMEAKEEIARLSKNVTELAESAEHKVEGIKNYYEGKLEQVQRNLETTKQMLKLKDSEIANYSKKSDWLEQEVEKMQRGSHSGDGSATRLLSLEKNLENTFQNLLLSEKQNIQLKSEAQSIKNDLDQMAQFYERDIQTREAEKLLLKNEIKKIQLELESTKVKASQSTEVIQQLKEQISTIENSFQQQSSVQQKGMETFHKKIVEELQHQVVLQTKNSQKWRSETKNTLDQLERVITELKMANHKTKQENKILNERLKLSNSKMLEYKKYLEVISQDVMKITPLVPEAGETLS